MFANYLKIAIRNLLKHKGYAAINILGLALGIATCLLLVLLVQHEWRYDRFHENGDRIFRTCLEYEKPDGEIQYQNMMFPDFTPALVAEFPAIEHASRLVRGSQDFKVGNEFYRQMMVEVDAPFFEMFTFPLLAGDPATALADPSGMVITAEVARTFFGVDDGGYPEVLGRTVSIPRGASLFDFQVTGVAAPLPANSSIFFDVAISFANYDSLYLGGNNWGGRTSTYIQLRADQGPGAFLEAVKPFIHTQFGEYAENLRENGYLAEGEDAYRLILQPLSGIHHNTTLWLPYEASAFDPLFSYILLGIGVLILLIACINFMTLSVGRSAGRAREVGVRKVMGALRGQLLYQFLGEAAILSVIAVALGLVLAWTALPFYTDLIDQELALGALGALEVAIVVVLLLVSVALVAGGYPALLLSRFQPAAVLKGQAAGPRRNALTRVLVVLQYTISISLIVCTLIMADQLRYMLNKDLGYDDELVLVVHAAQVGRADAPKLMERFRNTLVPQERVVRVARAGNAFTRSSDRNTWIDGDGITRSAYNFGVDEDYIDLMGMEIVAGRNFSRDHATDPTRAVLVNEALVREFEIADPVGKPLTNWLDWIYEESPIIIGVVKDFNFRSLHQEVQPAVMNMHPDYYSYLNAVLVRIKPEDISGTIALVEGTWNGLFPGKPFTYSFLNEDLAGQYMTEQRWTRIVTAAAILAIVIACLGLFGLATLSVTRRTKEIGIRKVLGASVPGVVVLIAGEFARLVGVAALLAWPLAFFGMGRWLETFAYRVDMGVWVFLLAGLAALGIALLTIAIQAVRAATANPVKSLRYE